MLIGKFNHLFAGDKTKLLFSHKQTSMEFRFYSQCFVLNLTMTIVFLPVGCQRTMSYSRSTLSYATTLNAKSWLSLMGGGLLRLPREVRTHSLLKGIKRMFSWRMYCIYLISWLHYIKSMLFLKVIFIL